MITGAIGAGIALGRTLSPRKPTQVQQLDVTDAAATAAALSTLVDSFASDPNMIAMAGSERASHALVADMMEGNLKRATAPGRKPPLIFCTEGQVAVALSLRYPEEQPFYGGLTGILHVWPTHWSTCSKTAHALREAHKAFEQQQGPHIHLLALTVAADQRGKGLGSRLLRHLASLADKEGLATYVEATSQRNRALYLRHGFKDVQQVRVGSSKDEIVWFAMARQPRGSSRKAASPAKGNAASPTSGQATSTTAGPANGGTNSQTNGKANGSLAMTTEQ
ncbi:hypothetical protein ABPG75_005846 [Micractinium tetrahymenae]